MKQFFKLVGIISIVPLLIGLYFFDNIKGYYRFKHYCAKEGGLRVYEPLEKKMGWQAKNKIEAQTASLLKDVLYVRYKDERSGEEYDLQYVGGDPQLDSSFKVIAADKSMEIKYVWRSARLEVFNEERLRRFGYEILDFKNSDILARYYGFSYSKFNREKTILDMPSYIYCFADYAKKNGDISGWHRALNKAFKN